MPGTLPRAVNDASVVTPVSVTRMIQLNTELETAAGYLFPAGVVSGGLVAPTTGFAVEVGAGVFVAELVAFVLAAPQSYSGATNPSTTIRLWGKIARTPATQANRADPDTYSLALTHTHGASYATAPASGPWIPLADWATAGSGVSGALDNEPAGKRIVLGNRQTIDGWYENNVPGSQSNVALARQSAAAAFGNKWIALRPGSITGIGIKSTEARTAGSLVVEVTKNGTAMGLTATLDAAAPTVKGATQAAGIDTFVTGDELGIQISSTGWTPTSADVAASLEIES